ncbi:MAG: hypothetical protein JWM74_1658 [Myxococcaceae bacterium]|nr:hypothetical protein [Myxococcaceae bacterium]
MARMSEDDEVARLRARVAELEDELASDRARIQAIATHIPAVIYVKDTDGRYLYGSKHGFDALGIKHEDAIGRSDGEIFPPELAARFRASDRKVREGGPMKHESYAVPYPGGPRHFSGVRFAIPGPDGSIIGVCGFAVDVTERVEMAEELQRLATTDALTGLANRRRFDTHLEAELSRSARSGEPVSLLLADIDRFKRYNDLYGHQAGDACLMQVARALNSVVRRPADLAARYGGEELALILPGTSMMGASGMASRAREALQGLAIEHKENDDRGIVTISMGVATVVGAWTPAELIAIADRALYAAKAGGRDRHVTVVDEHPPASVRRG